MSIVTDYERDGYAVVRQALEHDALEPIRQSIADGVDQFARKLHSESAIASKFEEEPFDRRLAAIMRAYDPKHEMATRLRSWDSLAFCRGLYDLIKHPRIVDVMQTLLGPDITCDGLYRMRPKLPGSRSTAFPWHQDSQYYGPPTQHMHFVTCWIPLVDTDEDNGCLWVIPESHRWELFDGEIKDDGNLHPMQDVEKRGSPVALPMRCGDFVVFSNMTFHGSKLNTTDRVRYSLDARYLATRGSRPVKSDLEQAAYDFLYADIQDRWPLVVTSSRDEPLTSWEQWRAACKPHEPLR